MIEYPIIASNINDFIFCPMSIYFHNLYSEQDVLTYHRKEQINGKNAHKNVDANIYSTSKSFICGIDAYSEKYNIHCKIDIYDKNKKMLIERKKKIHKLYDGQIFQLYAQYFSMMEMGYPVQRLRIYSMDDNKNYDILLPNEDLEMLEKYEEILRLMNEFDLEAFEQTNNQKCENCVYESVCSKSVLGG